MPRRELREAGERVEIISRCHVAAKAFSNGTKADKFVLSKLGSFRCGTLIIEECGQLPHYLWCQLCAIKKLGIRFLCLGDIANQQSPICDTFNQQNLELKADASFLRFLTDSNRLTLHEGRRSDARLFNFYSKLAEGAVWAGLSLKEQIELARKEFGKPPENHVPLFQLTISHKHRMSVIKAVQTVELQEARAAGKQCMWLPPIYSSMTNRTQGL